MRTFGIIVAVAFGLVAGLYFGGYMDGKVDVALTDKGKQTVTDGLEGAREGINEGLKSVTQKVNEGLEKAKVETAPQLKPQTEEQPSKQ